MTWKKRMPPKQNYATCGDTPMTSVDESVSSTALLAQMRQFEVDVDLNPPPNANANVIVESSAPQCENSGEQDVPMPDGNITPVHSNADIQDIEETSDSALRRLDAWIHTLQARDYFSKEEWQVKKATGDGNCLFYSLLQSNDPASALDCREKIAAWIEHNPAFVMEGQSVAQWLAQDPDVSRHSVLQYARALRGTTLHVGSWRTFGDSSVCNAE